VNKIIFKIDKETIVFNKYNRNINEENLNNTNVIDIKNLKFTEDYILENIDLVSTFINLVILKFNIKLALIKNFEISETILKLIKKTDNIKYISFTEDKELSYLTATLLLENKNLKRIDCYSLPEIMFYRFEKDKINTRCKILSTSNFFKNNNIFTFSDLYNKDKIIIEEILDLEDIDDMIYFFETNVNLKKIIFKRYSNQNLLTILNYLKKNNVKNVSIIIYESEKTTNNLLKDIKLFNQLNKKYNVNIKIKYSRKYTEKNSLKELNLILIRNILLCCVILCLLSVFIFKQLENEAINNINESMDEINQIIDNIENNNDDSEQQIIVNETEIKEENNLESTSQETNPQYVSSYYKEYSKVYNDLLSINKDTIGWLTVNNTRVNYPVVQTIDNDFYLNHAYDKTKNIAGWLYVDYRCDMDNISKNTIIYGHSGLKGNIMFSSLQKTLESKWYNNQNNLNIKFSIKEKEYEWKIFSIYVVDNTSDYLYTNFNSDEAYLNFINMIKNRSITNYEVEVNSTDKILTLSTCYKDNSRRLVIHAKML